MEKVRLPKEVVTAIDYARRILQWTDGNILVRTIRRDWESKDMQPLNDFVQTNDDQMKIAAALVNGYEVELCVDEQLLEVYKRGICKQDKSLQEMATGCFRLGMQNALSIVGKKVKGINDDEGWDQIK